LTETNSLHEPSSDTYREDEATFDASHVDEATYVDEASLDADRVDGSSDENQVDAVTVTKFHLLLQHHIKLKR
jgi:hypothetical protein